MSQGRPDDADEPSTDVAGGSPHDRVAFPFRAPPRAKWPKLRPDVVAVIFVGGCLGGWARYAATRAWPAEHGRFPWSTLGVNLAGAFVLGLVVVIAADVLPSRYLRPLAGTGFCGALTTFSSVVVIVDQLFAHHHAPTAVGYLTASVVGGLAAGWVGLVLGRLIAGVRRRGRRGIG